MKQILTVVLLAMLCSCDYVVVWSVNDIVGLCIIGAILLFLFIILAVLQLDKLIKRFKKNLWK